MKYDSVRKLYVGIIYTVWLNAVKGPAQAFTDSRDVYALNQLYISLNSPSLNGWSGNGGDPCSELWEGVACAGPNVTLLNLTAMGLTGGLGLALQNLTTLIVLDLSNNLLSGGLSLELPPHVQEIDLSSNQFTGNVLTDFSELMNLNKLNISNNHLSGALPDMFSSLQSITILDLSKNSLSGPLPSSFAGLASLHTLYLQDNMFTGTINMLAQLPLTDLDVSNNSFTGWIPSELKNLPSSKFIGNSFSIFPAPPPPPPSVPLPSGPQNQVAAVTLHSASPKKSIRSYLTLGKMIGIGAGSLLAMVLAVLVVLFFVSRRKSRDTDDKYDAEQSWHGSLIPPWKEEIKQSCIRSQDHKEELEELKPVVDSSLKACNVSEFTNLKPPPVPELSKMAKGREFSCRAQSHGSSSFVAQIYRIADLQLATDSFAEENLIHNGIFGKVFKGHLQNGQVIGVKKLDYCLTRLGEDEFLDLVSKISRFRHENILTLIGYCVEHGQYLLAYNFIGNSSLYENLHTDLENKKRLTWSDRVKIALGTARALEYLQEISKPPVILCNLSSFNILLDDDLSPHLSECGFANYLQQEQVSAEHLAYSAPEYTSAGLHMVENDIYSFGVVMLELLTGRRSFDGSRPWRERSLVRWAFPQLCDINALERMLDPSIYATCPKKSMSRFADIITQCLQNDPKFRPSMGEVVQYLEQIQNI
ncbi:hypothetical protein KP509_16G022100 [Ceratopteris richardii]|uniref:Protein kinase domain-containing protein n=1 Tax=Ceratopteris richardii TaxID=49495 RepID=A0A8T2SX87_CERRI|nr:hypothetical protein KP509_16G022100 [Ceratopteris richardii]